MSRGYALLIMLLLTYWFLAIRRDIYNLSDTIEEVKQMLQYEQKEIKQ